MIITGPSMTALVNSKPLTSEVRTHDQGATSTAKDGEPTFAAPAILQDALLDAAQVPWHHLSATTPQNGKVWPTIDPLAELQHAFRPPQESGLVDGSRLDLGFLLDAQHALSHLDHVPRSSVSALSNSSAPSYTTTHTSPPDGFLAPASPQHTASYSRLPQNTPPTCPLDAILLDFLDSRQREAARGMPDARLVGPAYPSVTSLLNPERAEYSHPVSKILTDILSKFPDISTLPEQVAVLYCMFLFMRWQICPTAENYDLLPEWMRPLDCQVYHPHPLWVDNLPFPQMREKLVTEYRQYAFEDFFIPFTTTIDLNWPFPDADLLIPGPDEELVISPKFEQHLRNLENWSLGEAFAKVLPGLSDTANIRRENTTQERDFGVNVPSRMAFRA